MNPFDLSRIQYPFSYGINAHVEAVYAYALQWGRKHKLIHQEDIPHELHFVRYTADFVSRVYALGDLERLCIISCWTLLWFKIDDDCDSLPAGRKRRFYQDITDSFTDILLHSKTSTRGNANIYAAGFNNVWQQMQRKTSPEWLNWFIDEQEEQMRVCEWEAANRDLGYIPRLTEFMEVRPYISGAYICICLAAMSAGIRLPDATYHQPQVRQMIRLCANVLSYANDLHSLNKELQENDVHNLIILLQKEKQLTLEAAIQETLQVHDTDLQEFLYLEQQVSSFRSGTDEELARFRQVLKAMMSGNHEWVLNNDYRYRAALNII
jgi:hypothetical protein